MAELTTSSVQQLLEVLEHAQRNHQRNIPFPTAYHDAVRDVSNRHRVTYQTIGDFRRRLGLRDISEYLDLITRWLRGDHEPLQRRIKQHSTPGVHGFIDQFFRNGGLATFKADVPATAPDDDRTARSVTAQSQSTSTDAEELRLSLSPELCRLLSLAHLAKVAPTLEETALVLLKRGFEVEKQRIWEFLNTTLGHP
jgi:hypothetical protein